MTHDFRLHELGWEGFQDLCGTIGREVWDEKLQIFSNGNDAGRDGAFESTWKSADGSAFSGPSVIQCKHFSSADASLNVSKIRDEIEKISRLVEAGRCENYILMSNGKLSGDSESEIRKAVLSGGAKNCFIYGKELIEKIILDNRKLRRKVPRLYGLGDLTQIIDERAYSQAIALLESMKYEIETFVPTQSYVSAVNCLFEHGFVILLGEPAAGKSVIASMLALVASDEWQSLTVTPVSAAEFLKYWNPDEPNQFFWVDDAFGATQHLEEQTRAWSMAFPKIKAAMNRGAKFVFTSRDYIWNSAKHQLKLESFPEISRDQVVIKVADISLNEKERILYNHLKMGQQPNEVRAALKPFLHSVAQNTRFLPEIARRLGSPFFTESLRIDTSGIIDFIENPESFLLSILRTLDSASLAALSLIGMSLRGLSTPINLDESQKEVLSLMGVSEANLRRALESMEGNFTKIYMEIDGSKYWVPRHPTLIDAMALFLSERAEMLDIYLKLAKVDRLIQEITCGVQITNGIVVPPSHYPKVFARVDEYFEIFPTGFPDLLKYFLTVRCGDTFLTKFFSERSELIELLLNPPSEIADSVDFKLLLKLHRLSILTELDLDRLAEHVLIQTFTWADPSIAHSRELQEVLGPVRVLNLQDRISLQFEQNFPIILNAWSENYDVDFAPSSYLSELRSAVVVLGFDELLTEIETLETELNDIFADAASDYANNWDGDVIDRDEDSRADSERDIFDDVDV